MKSRYSLKCVECSKTYPYDEVRYVCPKCSQEQKPLSPIRGILEIILHQPDINRKNYDPLSLLPLQIRGIIDYPVGNTPLIFSRNLSAKYDFRNLFIKDDSKNPTNSLKDRASILVVADAVLRGENTIATASTGNAASSLAGVCAFSGCESIIFVPSSAPVAKMVQTAKYGALIVPIDGTYDDAFDSCNEFCEFTGACNRNTAYNPMTTEGKKTVAIEIVRDLDFKAPDVVFVPVGDGSIVSGVVKGFKDLLRFRMIKKMPQVIAVQSEGSDAISRSFETGEFKALEKTDTIADSIKVSAPRNSIRAVRDIKESGGFCVRVSDEELLEAQSILASNSGIFAEPSASASLAGFIKVRSKLDKHQTIVILSTGDGLKDIQSAMKSIQISKPVKPDINNVLDFIRDKKNSKR